MLYLLPTLITLAILVAIEAAYPADNPVADEAIEGWEAEAEAEAVLKGLAAWDAATGGQD